MKTFTLLLFSLLLNFNSAFALDYYWVGGSGNWNDLSHWATTSGGATNHVSLPTPSDDVYFDINSFNGASQTVSLNVDAICRNMSWTGVTNNPALDFAGSSNRELNIYGSLTLVSGMTVFYSWGYGKWMFRSTSPGKTVISAAKDLSYVQFVGTAGGWTLQDDLTASNFVVVYEGTFNTNNFTINTGEFNSSTGCGGCNIRTVNLGSSIINCNSKWDIFGTALTLNTGTSIIRTPYFQSIGDATYYNVELNGNAANNVRVVGTNPVVFNNLDFVNGTSLDFSASIGWNNITVNNRLGLNRPGTTITFMIGSTTTVNGTIELPDPGAGCAALTTFQSSSSGTPATISKSSGNVTGSRLAIKGIIATGGASFTANHSIDQGGNSGWTINAPAATTYYWIGGTGNWNDGAHWAASSGGVSSGCIPSQTDDVIFDANSFSSASQTVSLTADAACKSMNWTGVTDNPRLDFAGSSNRELNIYGSLTLVNGMTVFYSWGYGKWMFRSTSAGNTVTSAGKDLSYLQFVGTNGGWTLQDDLTASNSVVVYEGTFNTNNYTINTGEFNSTTGCGGCNIRAVNLGSSIINCSTKWDIFGQSLTLNTGTSIIHTPYFQSIGDATYYNVELNASSTNTVRVVGTSPVVFNNLDFVNGTSLDFAGSIGWNNITVNNRLGLNRPGSTITFMAGSLITANNILELPDPGAGCGPLTILQSTVSGTAATLSKSSGSVVCSRMSIKDIAVTGGATFTANYSINVSGNSGWTINTPASVTYYWVGGTGSWNDGTHWATTSGGAAAGCIPSQTDDVVFDANSFTAASQTVSLNVDASCKSMNWTGVTNNPTLDFAGSSNRELNIYGSLTLASGMTIFYSWGYGKWMFRSSSTGNMVTSRGKDLLYVQFVGTGGSWTLQDDLTASNSVIVYEGTFNTNNYTVNTGEFNSTTGCGGCNIRIVNLGSSTINCTTLWNTFGSALTLNAGTSIINAHSFRSVGAQTYNTVVVDGASAFPYLYTSGDIFNDLTINTTVNTNFNGTGPMTINNDFIINGPSKTITINPAVQINLGNSFTVNSSVSDIITFQSTFNGVQATISKSSGIICIDYVALKDMNATGGATFYASLSTDNGNNTGWNFTSQSCAEVLPVSLLSFNGICVDNGVLFNWITASEQNSSHFNIEKLNGNSWQVIGSVTASGQSAIEKRYQLLTQIERTGQYRLAMVDKDGSVKYSKIHIAKCERAGTIRIIPNPAYHKTTFYIESSGSEIAQIKILNSTGQVIRVSQEKFGQGTNQIDIDLLKLPAGLYIIQMTSGTMNEKRSLIKLQ